MFIFCLKPRKKHRLFLEFRQTAALGLNTHLRNLESKQSPDGFIGSRKSMAASAQCLRNYKINGQGVLSEKRCGPAGMKQHGGITLGHPTGKRTR